VAYLRSAWEGARPKGRGSRAIAHILLGPKSNIASRFRALRTPRGYRRYVSSHDMSARAQLGAAERGRKRILTLHEDRSTTSTRFSKREPQRPVLFLWTAGASAHDVEPFLRGANSLAHYDPAHNAIVVSRVFDQQLVPGYAVEYHRLSRDAAPQDPVEAAKAAAAVCPRPGVPRPKKKASFPPSWRKPGRS